MATTKAEAPRRIWIDWPRNPADDAWYFLMEGITVGHVEYVRADLAPAGEDATDGAQLRADFWIDKNGEAHFICHTKDEDFATTKLAFQKFIALLQGQIDREQECPIWGKGLERLLDIQEGRIPSDAAPAGELVSREEVMRLVNDVLTSVLDVKAVFLLQHALDAIAALPPVAHVPVAARAAAEEVAKWMNMFHIVPMEVQEQNASTIERIILKHCGSVTPTQKDSGLDA